MNYLFFFIYVILFDSFHINLIWVSPTFFSQFLLEKEWKFHFFTKIYKVIYWCVYIILLLY